MCRRLIILALTLTLSAAGVAAKGRRTSADARRQRTQTERQMARTTTEFSETEKKLELKLREADGLSEAIASKEKLCAELKVRVDSIEGCIKEVSDSIEANKEELEHLRGAYVKAVRSARRNRREINAFTFIFSADNFRQSMRRAEYMRQFSKWRKSKAEKISDMMTRLREQDEELGGLRRQVGSLHAQAEAEARKLRADRRALDEVTKALSAEKTQLASLMRKQQKEISTLNDEIERLVAREEKEEKERMKRLEQEARGSDARRESKKPAKEKAPEFTPIDRSAHEKTTAEFAAMKGKLPSPLSHTYELVRHFGTNTHSKGVKITSNGVELETSVEARALAVHPGTVTAVYPPSNMMQYYTVAIRHGRYVTLYSRLKSVSVKKGDRVVAGTEIGEVSSSRIKNDRGALHFEIRENNKKLDPMRWLRR